MNFLKNEEGGGGLVVKIMKQSHHPASPTDNWKLQGTEERNHTAVRRPTNIRKLACLLNE